ACAGDFRGGGGGGRSGEVVSKGARNSVCSLPRWRGGGGEGVDWKVYHIVCPLPIPPPQAGEGTMWHARRINMLVQLSWNALARRLLCADASPPSTCSPTGRLPAIRSRWCSRPTDSRPMPCR